MSNIRKMFHEVQVSSTAEHFPLMMARMLERRMGVMAAVGVPAYRSHSSLGLNVDVESDRVTFEIIDNWDDRLVLKKSEIVFSDLPEWRVYVSKSLLALGNSQQVETFLQGAFSAPQESPLQKITLSMAERIGVRVGNDLELVLGDGPHSIESKDVYSKLSYIGLMLSPRMRVILASDPGQAKAARDRYAQEAFEPLILK